MARTTGLLILTNLDAIEAGTDDRDPLRVDLDAHTPEGSFLVTVRVHDDGHLLEVFQHLPDGSMSLLVDDVVRGPRSFAEAILTGLALVNT